MSPKGIFGIETPLLSCPPGWELDSRLTTLLYKMIIVSKSKKVKIGRSNSQKWTNLAEFSKEGSKMAVLPTTTTTMMMMMMTSLLRHTWIYILKYMDRR
jgi:hypothetical protein